ncbi:cutinase family protein [Nocardia sp. CA-120079]|uniref:cutinase family protein n=1 Tax=Nocardia sp. CA-120079 TaxID=3239974 RepID=UPI003D989E7F
MFMRKMIGAVAGTVMVGAAGAVGGAGAATAAPNGCPDLYVVAVPGTWETSDANPGEGMLASVTDNLPRNTRTDYVTYAATAFPWETDVYGRSKRQAIDNARGLVTAMAQQCAETKIALIGYSQGADAAGDLAAEIGTGLSPIRPERIAAVGLISDPRRSPTDALIGPPVDGAGAGGPRIGGFGFLTQKTRTICAVGDLYCAAPPTDFATRVAGFLAQASDPDPAQVWRYQQEAFAIFNDLMATGVSPLIQNQLADPEMNERKREFERFYNSFVHQNYPTYVVDSNGATATAWLRQWLIGLA